VRNQPHALTDDLVAPGHLPPQRQGLRIRHPDLGQEVAGIQLGQHGRVDRVGLDLGVRDHPHLGRVGDHHAPDMRRDHLRDSRKTACPLSA